MKKKRGTLNFTKYVLSQFLVVVIVISVLGGYLYSFFYDTAYSDFQLVNDQHVSAFAKLHENELKIVDDIVTQMGLADDITRFYLEKQPDKAMKLEMHMKRYVLVSQFFSMMLYQYHDDRFIYSQLSSIRTDVFFEQGCVLENISPTEFREEVMKSTVDFWVLPEQKVSGRFMGNYLLGEENASFYMHTIPGYWDETLIFMVPGSYYDEILTGDSAEMRTDFLYYDGEVIVSRGAQKIAADQLQSLFTDRGVESKLEEQRRLQERVTIENGEYLLTVSRGESGMYYGSLQDMRVFHQKFQAEQWVILFLILVCAMIAIFITGFFSSRMMQKVKGLSNLLDEEPTYDLSYIERGIQTLVATKKASEAENRTFRKAKFIRNFFRGYQGSRQDVIDQARKVGLSVDRAYYVVVLIRNYEVDNGDIIYSRILEMIDREPDVEGYGIHLVNNNQNLFVLFGDKTDKLKEALDRLLELEREYCQDYVIAVSNVHTDFDEASKAYLEADTAFDYRYLVNNSEVIRFADVVQDDYERLPLETYFRDLKYAINTGNREAVETSVQDICRKLENENVSLYAFRMLYSDILQVLIAECKGDKLWLDKFYNAFTISQCTSIKEFHDLLYEASVMIIDSQSGKKPENSDIVRAAVQYMQQNYQNPNLTMNALAEHLNISSVTLSIDFKNEMEVKPSEYLANLRIERAKDLLRNTNMLVKEISNAIGYEDDGSFTRRFKKHTGMTPGQYREKYR